MTKAEAYAKVREKIVLRFGSNVAEEIFSEFEESEDERIRQDIMVLVKDWWDRVNKDNISTKEQMIAWLEKQKDTNVLIQEASEKAYTEGMRVERKHWFEKQDEQKPILDFKASNWYVSKVDGKIHDLTYNPTDKKELKKLTQSVTKTSEQESKSYKDAEEASAEYRKFREECGIKDPVMLDEIEEAYYNGATSIQKPVWSEEDDKRLINTTISFLNHYADKGYENAVECIDWLKSLKTTNVGNSSITVEGMYNQAKDASV